MIKLIQSPNVGVDGNRDHASIREYCYTVKFLWEDGDLACMEPFTIPATCSNEAMDVLIAEADRQCEEFGYYDYDVELEDIC